MTPATKRLCPLWLTPLLLIATSPLSAPAASLSRGPYLQLSTPESIHVVWRTDGESKPLVRYGLTRDNLNLEAGPASILTRVAPPEEEDSRRRSRSPRRATGDPRPLLHSAPEGTLQYEAHLTGLTPDTRYYYAVYDDRKRLTKPEETFTFRTHPVPGTHKPMRFWVVGDSGTGRSDQASVYKAMVDYTTKQQLPLDFYIHVGDMAYSRGRDREFQRNFFEPYEPTLSQIVCWAAMGNHEGATSRGANGVGPYYDAYILPTRGEAGGVPSGLEAFYSFDYGRVHFICLDSHDLGRKPTDAMARWLRLDLANTRADWLIAFWHHPPYTKGSHDSDKEKQLIEMRRFILPILESGGVDLVLTGHSHIYERSMLIDGAYATPTVAEMVVLDDGDGDPAGDGAYRKSAGLQPNEGNVQIVAGHGGTGLSRKGTSPVMRKILLEHGSVVVDIEGDTLNAIMLNRAGVERDRFSMIKRGTVSPRRIALPWQPPVWVKKKTAPDVPVSELPEDFITAIPRGAEWHYLAGGQHPEGEGWRELGFEATGWKTGKAGFGYGDDDDATLLDEMKDRYTAVYIRREFTISQADYVAELGLMIRYDDAFIAYINGKEVLRKGVEGHGREADEVKSHDGKDFRYLKIAEFDKVIRTGTNVLAIEGHNVNDSSSDFTLDPYLVVEE